MGEELKSKNSERENLHSESNSNRASTRNGIPPPASRGASAAVCLLLGILVLPSFGRSTPQQGSFQQTSSQDKPAPSKGDQARPKPAAVPAGKGDCGGKAKVTVQTPFGPMLQCPPDAASKEGQAAPTKPATPPQQPPSAQKPAPNAASPAPSQQPTGPAAQSGGVPTSPSSAQPPAETGAAQNAGQQKPGSAPPNPPQQPESPQSQQQPPSSGAPQSPAQQGQQPGASQPQAGQQPAAGANASIKPVHNAGGGISLNLENADLYQVLRIIGTELKLNYVVDPSVKGSVTISTAGTVSKDDLFTLLQTILQLNGAMMVKVGAYYRVMPIGEAKQAPVPLEFVKEASAPPPNEGLAMEVVPMHFVSAADMGKILTPFVSPAGSIVVEAQGNILLITETQSKLKEFRDLIHMFDSPEFARQRVRLYQIKNALVENLVPELNDVFSGYALGGKTSAIHFIPLRRLNMLLAVAPEPDVFSDVEEWINRLDQPAPASGLRNYVYMVQNAKASDLQHILNSLYGAQTPQPQTQAPATPQEANPLVLPQAQPTAQTSESSATESAPRLNGDIRIMSDDQDNALIIQCTPHDYALLLDTIKQLDILPRQVLINAKIYQVSLTGNLSFGISAYLNQTGQLPAPLTSTGSFVPGQSGGDLQAATFALIGKTRALELFLNATQNRGRVRMLSAPSILVTDNTTATIQVGAQVPVPLGSALTPIQSSGSSVFAQTIQYRDTGVILTVTPRINASGIVNLKIVQQVSSPSSNTTSGIVAPVINQTQFQTSVVLHDGEPLALGGLITTTNSLSRDRIPLLGEIPGLGALFGNTTRQTSRNELVLVLTPYVIQNMSEAAKSTSVLMQDMKHVKEMMKKPD